MRLLDSGDSFSVEEGGFVVGVVAGTDVALVSVGEGAMVFVEVVGAEEAEGPADRPLRALFGRSDGRNELMSRRGMTAVGCRVIETARVVAVEGAPLRSAPLTRIPPPTPIATPAADATTQSHRRGIMRRLHRCGHYVGYLLERRTGN